LVAANSSGTDTLIKTCYVEVLYVVDVKVENNLSEEFVLYQNYPNPFNPSTIIEYIIPGEDYVSLVVYNSLGEVVAVLVNEIQSSGKYTVDFSIDETKRLSSGIYIYKLTAGDFIQTQKMILLR